MMTEYNFFWVHYPLRWKIWPLEHQFSVFPKIWISTPVNFFELILTVKVFVDFSAINLHKKCKKGNVV